MKINTEIDCTPEEARHFFGLPDLRPMQAAIMGKLEQQVLDAMSSIAPDTLLRAWLPYWLPFGGMSPEQVQKMMSGFLSASFGGGAQPGRTPPSGTTQ
jgi:hypothetical protein